MDKINKGLFIQLYSIHGLIRSKNLELGRDSDTGGQTKYVLELGKALSKLPEVEMVELITRLINDKNLPDDYSKHIEQVDDKFRIIRIQCGGTKYIRKELLWDHLEEFVDKSIKYIKSLRKLPDVIHSHYADAGFVCTELTKFFGIPFIHTAHSLGKVKLEKLLNGSITQDEIEKQYKIFRRIKVEEEILNYADMIVTSTSDEITAQYNKYDNVKNSKFSVIPPGIELEKFYPYNDEREWDEEAMNWRKRIREELLRFFMNINKPIILTICRPDKRKNISGLIKAYGEDIQLREMANLAIFAGIRKDIQSMPDNEKEVLTEMLLLMDKYDLYGYMAIPKRHDVESEVPEFYRIAAETGGVFVNAAYSENFGITLIESIASGLPVVSTNHGGPNDIIKNLESGILVEVEQFRNISKAIKELLNDKDLWNRFSQNGIERIGKYYSWDSHVEKYMNKVYNIISKEKKHPNIFSEVGKKLITTDKLLVSDIDDTLLGDNHSLYALMDTLKANDKKISFGVATGRTVESAIKVLKEYNLSLPDFIISSVGAELYYNNNGNLILSSGWESHIAHLWNPNKIKETLNEFDFLKIQEEANQKKYKISYYVDSERAELDKARLALVRNKIKCNFIFSHQQFLDILPFRASKGRAIRYLSYRWNIPYESILVCGDSGNDEDMLRGEMLGVVVSNYSEELGKLKGKRKVYFATYPFAGGIIDGIRYYNFLNEKEAL